MRLVPYSLSDVGRRREHNEDSFLVRADLGLYAVADGMGGHQAGERASRMALDLLAEHLALLGPDEKLDKDALLARFHKAMQHAGAGIFDAGQEDAALHGMGTTTTALWIRGDRAYLAHVGDSRAYLLRDDRMQQLSDDHTWVSEQVRLGLMTELDAHESQYRHIITRSVGFEREVAVDGSAVALQLGDCFLLCSDGLSNYIEGEELRRLLNAHYYSEVPRLLIDLANERGGDDNITVVLVQVANSAAAEHQDIEAPSSAAPATAE